MLITTRFFFESNYIWLMKFLSRIILLLFVSFQFSSTVLSLMDFDKESKVAIGFLDENEDSSDEKETNKELNVEYIDTKWNEFVFFTTQTTAKMAKPYLLKE